MRSNYYFLNRAIALLALGVFNMQPAFAQDANANARKNALAKAQFLLRQATGEKAELQQQLDAQKQQIDKLTKELAQTKTSATDTQQKMSEKFSGTLEQWKQHDEKSNAQLAALREQLKDQAQQAAQLDAQLKVQTENFSVCYGNNKQLFDLNRELLDRYEHKGVLDAVHQKEPFTGLKQVEIENLVQDYRYRNDDLKIGEPPKNSTGESAGNHQALP